MENQAILSEQKKAALADCAKWANFFAIASFVSVGISLLSAIITGGSNPLGIASVIGLTLFSSAFSIALAVLLYFFNKHAQAAIASGDTHTMDRALYNFKWYFMLTGILIVIGLSIACIGIVLGALFAA